MKDILFSVVLVTYNQEEYITQTLDSILEQVHNYSYEIIIGDDYSTDNTRDILLKYKERFPDIITLLFNECNVGVIKNYFNVINHCSGKYIMECAGDDYWLPGKVALQISFMEEHPEYGMCYGKAKCFLERKKRFTRNGIGFNTTTINSLLESNRIPALTICMRTALLNKYISEIDPLSRNWQLEDYPIWLWFVCTNKIYFINKNLAVYRYQTESVSHSNDLVKLENFHFSVINIKSVFIERYKIIYQINLDEVYLSLAYIAVLNGQYSEYKKQLMKVQGNNFKISIKKIIANIYLIFKMYSFCLKIVGQLFNLYKI